MAEGSSKHFCQLCNENFNSHAGFLDHKRRSFLHPHFCGRCELEFMDYDSFRQHCRTGIMTLTTEASGNPRCSLCRKSFQNPQLFHKHVVESKDHTNTCPVCYLDFHSGLDAKEHKAANHSANSAEQSGASSSTVATAPTLNVTPQNNGASTSPPPPPPSHSLPQRPSSSALHPPRSSSGSTHSSYPCRHCICTFGSLVALNKHYDAGIPFHAKSLYRGGVRCSLCSGIYRHLQEMKAKCRGNIRHMNSCLDCLLDFHTPKALKLHRLALHPIPSRAKAHHEIPPAEPAPVAGSSTSSSGFPPPLASGSTGDTCLEYSCDRCQEKFATQALLDVHNSTGIPLRRPGGSNDYSCVICNMSFGSECSQLKDHVRFKHQNGCVTCFLDFHNPDAFYGHLRTHPPNPEVVEPPLAISTPRIQEELPRSRGSSYPRRYHHYSYSYNHNFNRRYASNRFVHQPPFSCRRCWLEFPSFDRLQEHILSSAPILRPDADLNGEVDCAICDIPFQDIRSLRDHLSHEPIHDTACVRCLLDFHSLFGLETHSIATHAPPVESQSVPEPESDRELPNQIHDSLSADEPNSLPEGSEISSDADSDVGFFVSLHAITSARSYPREDPPDPWGLSRASATIPQHQGQPSSYARRTGSNTAQYQGSLHSIASTLLDSPSPGNPPPSRTKGGMRGFGKKPDARKSIFKIPCPLCLDVAVDLTSMLCGHVGCEACLVQSLSRKPECPVCRKPTTTTDLHPIFL